eukprot:TRINITY_DN4304_c0_g1_i1.p1 TRINITY_DN4304_c0_g1~~TRINITY_DN4304_c0_g1_i1.p1  ORF type:complete len:464 (+),score=97.64 TRINITY_DN4304_c0_g1_i1:998-2389(+)
MPLINTSYVSSSPITVNVPAEKLIQLLLDVPTIAKVYPTVESVESQGNNTYKWTMQERNVGNIRMKASHVNKYSRSGNKVSWENVSGGNMSTSGKFIVEPKGPNACTLSAEVNAEAAIEIPSLLVAFAKQVGNREMTSTWNAFLQGIKKTAESGTISKVAIVDEPVVKDQKFEKVRLDKNLRKDQYNTMVSDYYDVVTEVYQSGWGNHFHFASFKEGESLESAIKRLEETVAQSAGIKEKSLVLDVGCGVGGPTLHIAKVTGCTIRGLNINAKQVGIATQRAKDLGLAARASFDHGDAMKMPYKDNTFDAITFFESTCHMPDKQAFLKECYRVLKPGGRIAGAEWLQCDNPTEHEVTQFIEPICAHHSVPHMGSLKSYRDMMEKAGFKVHIAVDQALEGDILKNWEILDSKTVNAFKSLPKGTVDPTAEMMISGGIALSEGARSGAFVLGRFLATKDLPRAKL